MEAGLLRAAVEAEEQLQTALAGADFQAAEDAVAALRRLQKRMERAEGVLQHLEAELVVPRDVAEKLHALLDRWVGKLLRFLGKVRLRIG